MDNCSNPILSREEARIGSHVLVIAKPAIPREGLTLLLRQNGFDVVTAAENLERIEERACMAGSPDLIVIDLFSGDEPSAWIAGLAALRQRFSTARIVLLDHPVTAEWLDVCLKLGLNGYLSRDRDPSIVSLQLDLIQNGVALFPPELVARALPGLASIAADVMVKWRMSLTLPEMDMKLLNHVAAGATDNMIAKALGMNVASVKSRMKCIRSKFCLASRAAVAVWAYEHGLARELRD